MEFTVRVEDGDVYINDEFVNQLCFSSDAIGSAIAEWLYQLECKDSDGEEYEDED